MVSSSDALSFPSVGTSKSLGDRGGGGGGAGGDQVEFARSQPYGV